MDGANAARDFLRSHGVSEADSQKSGLRLRCTRQMECLRNCSQSPHLLPKAPTWILSAQAMTTSLPRSGTPSRRLIRIRRNLRKTLCKPFTTASSIARRPLRAPVWPMSWPTRTQLRPQGLQQADAQLALGYRKMTRGPHSLELIMSHASFVGSSRMSLPTGHFYTCRCLQTSAVAKIQRADGRQQAAGPTNGSPRPLPAHVPLCKAPLLASKVTFRV